MPKEFVTLDANEAVADPSHTDSAKPSPFTPSPPPRQWRSPATNGRPSTEESLGHRAGDRRNAVRGRRGRRGPRDAANRFADHHIHRVAGLAPDDPESLQDRRRTAAVLLARHRADAGHSRAFDLRRSLRRHGLPPDRLGDARFELRRRKRRTWPSSPMRARSNAACRSCISSTGSALRTRSRKSTRSEIPCCAAMIKEEYIRAFRDRALTPDRPAIRGTAQNPDVFFQAREACNPLLRARSRDRAERSWTTLRR